MELEKYPIIAILKDGTYITKLNHEIFNQFSSLIALCKADLTKEKVDTKTTIIIDEEKRIVYAQSFNGKIYSYSL